MKRIFPNVSGNKKQKVKTKNKQEPTKTRKDGWTAKIKDRTKNGCQNFKPTLRRSELCKNQAKATNPATKNTSEKRIAFPPQERANQQLRDSTCPLPNDCICVTVRLHPPLPLPFRDCGRKWGLSRRLSGTQPQNIDSHDCHWGCRLTGRPLFISSACTPARPKRRKQKKKRLKEIEREGER